MTYRFDLASGFTLRFLKVTPLEQMWVFVTRVAFGNRTDEHLLCALEIPEL